MAQRWPGSSPSRDLCGRRHLTTTQTTMPTPTLFPKLELSLISWLGILIFAIILKD